MTMKFIGGSDQVSATLDGGQDGFNSFSAAASNMTPPMISPARVVPIGGFVQYTDFIPNAVNPNGQLIAAIQPGSVGVSGGTNYGGNLGDGQAVTANVSSQQPSAISGDVQLSLTTSVKPDGTITQTETLTGHIEVSQAGLENIEGAIQKTVGAFFTAIWNGLTYAANQVETFAVGLGSYVEGMDQGPGQHQQIVNPTAATVFAPSASTASGAAWSTLDHSAIGLVHPGLSSV